MSFRSAHALVGASVIGLLAGCSEKPKPKTVPRLTADEVQAQREVCGFKPGMKAIETLPKEYPVGKDIPIEHIILIMNENRSFDHYFSELTGKDVDVAPRTASNPDSHGEPVVRFHFDSKCMGGGGHGWDVMHADLNGGAMDGFVKANGDSHTVMGYYDGDDLPYYYALARNFAMSDREFSPVLGPTWPNRMFYFAATSWGLTGNSWAPQNDPEGNPYPSIFSEMNDAGVAFRVYHDDVPTPGIIPGTLNYLDRFANRSQFYTDVANGILAPVTYVEATDLGTKTLPIVDEGPPGNIQVGQNYVSGVVSTIMNSPFWKNSVIFLTYDEAGGMYDHVVPPKACEPDDLPVQLGTDSSQGTFPAKFDQYGFRVPFFVISPYARRNYVSHVARDHTGITRFIEAKFDLPAMTKRDANIDPPYDMFDFEHPDFSIPDLPVIEAPPFDPNHPNCP